MGINTKSEEYRYQCEIRYILQWRTADRNVAMNYISDVRKKRGDAIADKMQKDCAEQWSKGNRGAKGDWR